MAQAAIVRKTVKKMMKTMTMGAKINHISSNSLLGMMTSNSGSSTFGRIIPHNNSRHQLTTSTKTNMFPCHFSPLSNKNQLQFFHPSSSSSCFVGVRHMSSESALQKAWVFAVTQRVEAHAKLQEIWEICEQPTLAILESVPSKLVALSVVFMGIQWVRTKTAKPESKILAHNSYHLLLEFKLNRYAEKSKVDVTLLDGKKVCVVYMRHTHFYSPSKLEHKVLTLELPEGRYDDARFVSWFNKQAKSVIVEIFSVKPATKVPLIYQS